MLIATFTLLVTACGQAPTGDADDADEWDSRRGPTQGDWAFTFSVATQNTLFATDPAPSTDVATLRAIDFDDSVSGNEFVDADGLWPNEGAGPSWKVERDGRFEFSSESNSGGAASSEDFPCIDGFSRDSLVSQSGWFKSSTSLEGTIRVEVAYSTNGTCTDADLVAFANDVDSVPDYWGAEVNSPNGTYEVGFVASWIPEPGVEDTR